MSGSRSALARLDIRDSIALDSTSIRHPFET